MKDKSRFNSKYLIIAALIFIVAILYFSPVNTNRHQKLYSIAHRETITMGSMRYISVLISLMVKDSYVHPVTNKDIIAQKNILFMDGDLYLQCNDQENYFYDAWNTPILIKFHKPAIYEFVSYGQNKRDDFGKGDDIVRVFDLSGNELKQINIEQIGTGGLLKKLP